MKKREFFELLVLNGKEIDKHTTEAFLMEKEGEYQVLTYSDKFSDRESFGGLLQEEKEKGWAICGWIDYSWEIQAIRSVVEDGEDFEEAFKSFC